MSRILYIDDEESNLLVFQSVFKRHYDVSCATSADQALTELSKGSFDVVITDQRMPGKTGIDLLTEISDLYPKTERILLTAYTDMDALLMAINKAKLFYYVTKPWDPKELKLIIERAIETGKVKSENERLVKELKGSNEKLLEKNNILFDANNEIKNLKKKLEIENQYLKKEISQFILGDTIIYKSKVYDEVLKKLNQVAKTNATVLILGETGTGKELLARAVYQNSNRSAKNFIKVNCAAIPISLIESELFGHIKGSFTGAIANKVGLFELADSGTIFLDEIGELPFDMQSKLLRVLQEGEFNRIGDSKVLKVDVRIIAATNRNLEAEVRNGKFRSDLYFRLNVFPIYNPGLSKRKEDIPLLIDFFIKKHSKRIGKEIKSISSEALKSLMEYDWPGNIRELENYVERAIILTSNGILDLAGWLPVNLSKADQEVTESLEVTELKEAEKNHIIKILDKTNWKIRGKGGAAEILNLPPTTLGSKMKKLGISNKKSLGNSL